MRVPRLEKARARLALWGALLCAIFLALLALGARGLVRSMTFADIDEELYTLSVALGSSFELEGLEESKRDTLKAGLEANAFEFRLANHSAIVFKGDVPIAASGNLLKQELAGGIGIELELEGERRFEDRACEHRVGRAGRCPDADVVRAIEGIELPDEVAGMIVGRGGVTCGRDALRERNQPLQVVVAFIRVRDVGRQSGLPSRGECGAWTDDLGVLWRVPMI